jgi:hypothetical protein
MPFPIALVLGAASLAGGIMQAAGGKKTIDPEWLKQHFGATAVTEEMITLFNSIINSPYGQQIMTDAASQGSQFESALRSNVAQAGLGAGEGGTSGASIFSESAAGGATKSLQGQARAGIFQQTLPIAANLVNARLNAYMGQPAMNQPTPMASLGAAIGNAAGTGLANVDWGAKTPSPPPARGLNQATDLYLKPSDFRSVLAASAGNTNAVQRPSRFAHLLGY